MGHNALIAPALAVGPRDVLTPILRDGAQQMIVQAIEKEASLSVEASRD